MSTPRQLTSATIVSEAERLLSEGGYATTRNIVPAIDLAAEATLLGEDAYSVVAIVVYPTFESLLNRWVEAQGVFVERLSQALKGGDAKAWEGYLVLLTPVATSSAAHKQVLRIRYDTHRVRKLVATGDELSTLADIERTIAPLLPIHPSQAGPLSGDPLGELIERVRAKSPFLSDATQVLVDAFRERDTVLERVHDYLSHRR